MNTFNTTAPFEKRIEKLLCMAPLETGLAFEVGV